MNIKDMIKYALQFSTTPKMMETERGKAIYNYLANTRIEGMSGLKYVKLLRREEEKKEIQKKFCRGKEVKKNTPEYERMRKLGLIDPKDARQDRIDRIDAYIEARKIILAFRNISLNTKEREYLKKKKIENNFKS